MKYVLRRRVAWMLTLLLLVSVGSVVLSATADAEVSATGPSGPIELVGGATLNLTMTFQIAADTAPADLPTALLFDLEPDYDDFATVPDGRVTMAAISSSSPNVDPTTCPRGGGGNPAQGQLSCRYLNAQAGDSVSVTIRLGYSPNSIGTWTLALGVANANGDFSVDGYPPLEIDVVPAGGQNDVDGDGAGDVLATTSSGALIYYRDTAGDFPPGEDHPPFVAGALVGAGWQGYSHLSAADLNGDGYADILATDPSGNLQYYENSGNATTPYGSSTRIGVGWQGFTRVMTGDIDGDGYADILAVAANGNLYYYPNSKDPSVPFSSGQLIGTGWQGFSQLLTADVNGDGFADLVAITPDGTMREYENTGSPSRPFIRGQVIGAGWSIFTHIVAADTSGPNGGPDGFAELLGTTPDGALREYADTQDATSPYVSGTIVGTGWQGLAIF